MFIKYSFVSDITTDTNDVRFRIQPIQSFANYLVNLNIGFTKVYENIPTTSFTSSSTWYSVSLQYKNCDWYVILSARGGSYPSFYYTLSKDPNINTTSNSRSGYQISLGGGYYQYALNCLFYINTQDKEVLVVGRTGDSYPKTSDSGNYTIGITGITLERFDEPSIKTEAIQLTDNIILTNIYQTGSVSSTNFQNISGSLFAVDTSTGINKIYKLPLSGNNNWLVKNRYQFTNLEGASSGDLVTMNGKQYIILRENELHELG